jgi:hypothetical protein
LLVLPRNAGSVPPAAGNPNHRALVGTGAISLEHHRAQGFRQALAGSKAGDKASGDAGGLKSGRRMADH